MVGSGTGISGKGADRTEMGICTKVIGSAGFGFRGIKLVQDIANAAASASKCSARLILNPMRFDRSGFMVYRQIQFVRCMFRSLGCCDSSSHASTIIAVDCLTLRLPSTLSSDLYQRPSAHRTMESVARSGANTL